MLSNHRNQTQLPILKYLQRITYNADGTSAETVAGRTDKGSWDFAREGKILYVNNESRGTARYIMVELTKERFTYQMLNGPDTLTFYMVPFSAKDTLNKPAMPQPHARQAPQDQPSEGDPRQQGPQPSERPTGAGKK
jgi:hypothetical protein